MKNQPFILVNAIARFFICLALASAGPPSFAGSRDGFFVLVIDLDSGKSPISVRLVDDYFNGRFPEDLYSCADSADGRFELVYLRKRPKGITVSMIDAALAGDQKKIERIRDIIGAYKDKDLRDGFDFVLPYRSRDDILHLYAISSARDFQPVRRYVKIGSNANILKVRQDFVVELCKISSLMPYMATP